MSLPLFVKGSVKLEIYKVELHSCQISRKFKCNIFSLSLRNIYCKEHLLHCSLTRNFISLGGGLLLSFDRIFVKLENYKKELHSYKTFFLIIQDYKLLPCF